MTQDNVHGAKSQRINTANDYIESLRGRSMRVYLFGELITEPVDHPMIRPSIHAMAESYDLAVKEPELATALSPFTGERVNRFLHIATSAGDCGADDSTPDPRCRRKVDGACGGQEGTAIQRPLRSQGRSSIIESSGIQARSAGSAIAPVSRPLSQ